MSGRQAAHLVKRVIDGENTANMPYERYKRVTIGVNLDAAKALGKTIPAEIMTAANTIVENNVLKSKDSPKSLSTSGSGSKKVAIFQFTNNPSLDETTKGITDGLKETGVINKYNLAVDYKNANGDFPTAQSIAKDIVSKSYDYIITASTIAMQVTANNNKKIPHVFCTVTDPVSAGVAENLTNHIQNLTGLATPQPVESTIKLMRKIFPSAKTIGMIWNNSEANSEFCTLMARKAAQKYGFKIVESTVSSTNEIDQALSSLINEKIDLFYTAGDITVSMAVPSIAKRLENKGIPYITNTPADLKSGVMISLGADYYNVGKEAAKVFQKVIEGSDTKKIPIVKYVPEELVINLSLAKKLKVNIPEEIIKTAREIK
jgi:ABC-type uncharacterized transport system substrate-binding protein